MINQLKLGSIDIPAQLIFWTKSNVSAILPCVKLMPGRKKKPFRYDILLIPHRQVNSFNDLEPQEIFDIGLATRFLTKGLEKYYSAKSSTVFIHNYNSKDPESIQQTFVHIIPRKENDFAENDHIYQRLETYDAEFVKQFKWSFTVANSGMNGELEIQGIEAKKHNQFLDSFQKEDNERA